MLEGRLLARLEKKKAQLEVLRSLPTAAVRRLHEQLTVEWIYNSNAIEGNTLSLRKAAEGTPYSQDYLSLLARKGRLEAVKRGRVWYTTRRAVREYQRSATNI